MQSLNRCVNSASDDEGEGTVFPTLLLKLLAADAGNVCLV